MTYDEMGLPDETAAALPKPLRKALHHPLRRMLLRALDASGTRRSPSELVATRAVPCSPAAASYHLQKLCLCGLVRDAGLEPVAGNIKHYFAAKVEKGPVAAALRSTEDVDRRLLPT